MPSCLLEPSGPPTSAVLVGALGAAAAHWRALVALAELEGAEATWKFQGEGHGWQLRLVHRRRSLAYLIPHPGCFTAALPLPDPAVEALLASRLPRALKESVAGAPRSPEGRPARLEVAGSREARHAASLLRLALKSRAAPRRRARS